jgi:hypothetical protein
MSYTINLTDGAVFATIADGTINTTSSMTLVGKNYAGYGQFLDTNFIHFVRKCIKYYSTRCTFNRSTLVGLGQQPDEGLYWINLENY